MATPSFAAVPGSEREPMPGARAVGAADANQWVELTLKLRRQRELPELDQRPAQRLTREQLAAQFGAAPADVEAVTQELARQGLTVLGSDAARRTVRVAGPVSAMESVFQVKLMQFTHERGDYRGRVGAVHVPEDISPLVEGVFGLDDRRVVKRRRPQMRRVSLQAAAAHAPAHRPWFFPAELAQIYDFPAGDGAGQTVALFEFGGGYFEDDLRAFCRTAGVDVPTVSAISVDHASTQSRDGAEGEVMLDVEVVAGACPKADIAVYFSSFTEKGWIDVLDAAIHDDERDVSVISISWGDAEDNASWTRQALLQVNESLKEAALLGITVCVASGDDGTDDQVGDGHAHVDFPSSSPYVLGVGGTILRVTKGKRHESAWKDGDGLRRDHGGSTGGGVSVRFPPPAWQSGLDVTSVNPQAAPGRVVPDVSAVASANTGFFIVVDGQAEVSGGTSASAPLWAALVARMNAQLQSQPGGKRVGYLTPLLYRRDGSGSAVGARGCNDVTHGNNATAVVGGYKSRAGYDAVTGWGSPKGKDLLAAITPLL